MNATARDTAFFYYYTYQLQDLCKDEDRPGTAFVLGDRVQSSKDLDGSRIDPLAYDFSGRDMSHDTVQVRIFNLIEVDIRDLDPEDQACSICHEPMQMASAYDLHDEPGAEIVDCGHVFGLKCILRWLKLQTRCPLCRSTVMTSQRVYRRSEVHTIF